MEKQEEAQAQANMQMQAQPPPPPPPPAAADAAFQAQALPTPQQTQEINNNSNNNVIVVHNTPGQTPPPALAKRGSSNNTRATSSRCTRSQAAPNWTVEETLVLLNEIAALDEDWLKALSSYQRWKMISDNCATMNVIRPSNHCKRRWETLLSDYSKIRAWETNAAPVSGSYWTLQPTKRKQFDLPASFDQDVYGSMDAVIKAQEARATSAAVDTDSEDLTGLPKEGKDDSSEDYEDILDSEASDSDYLIDLPKAKGQAEEVIGMLEAEMAAVDADSGSEETGTKTIRSTKKEQEIANKLKANAEQIHAILRGEIPDNVIQGRDLVDLTKPNATETEFTRRQADELIKSFGLLVSTLDQFNKLIKDGEFEGISLMDSMAQ